MSVWVLYLYLCSAYPWSQHFSPQTLGNRFWKGTSDNLRHDLCQWYEAVERGRNIGSLIRRGRDWGSASREMARVKLLEALFTLAESLTKSKSEESLETDESS